MSVDLGCSPAHFVCPSADVIGAPAAWDLGRDVPPEPPCARTPAWVGIGHLARQPTAQEQSSTLDDPTEVLSWGHWLRDGALGGGVIEQTRTHVQHRQRDCKKCFQLIPLWLQSQHTDIQYLLDLCHTNLVPRTLETLPEASPNSWIHANRWPSSTREAQKCIRVA